MYFLEIAHLYEKASLCLRGIHKLVIVQSRRNEVKHGHD